MTSTNRLLLVLSIFFALSGTKLLADGTAISIISTPDNQKIEQAIFVFLSGNTDTLNMSYPLGFSEKGSFAYIEKTAIPFRPDIRYRMIIVDDMNKPVFQGCSLYIGSHFHGNAGIGGDSWNDPKFSVESYISIMGAEIDLALKKYGINGSSMKVTTFRKGNTTPPMGTANIIEQKDYDGLQTDYSYSIQIQKKEGVYKAEQKERKERLKSASVIGMIERNTSDSIVAIIIEDHKGFEDEDFVSVKYVFCKKSG